GRILGDGTSAEILTPDLLAELYGGACDLLPHPAAMRCPTYCVPRSLAMRARSRGADQSVGFDIAGIRTGSGRTVISDGLSMTIPGGRITAIVGPNACGKSTLMRTCARLQQLGAGSIHLDGKSIASGSHRALARRLAMLGQEASAPEDLLVEDVVA